MTLTLRDGGSEPEGRHRVAYVCERGHAEIFRGDDISIPAEHAMDSDAAVAAVCGFLSLRPGDTDPDYFDNYTTGQRDFVQSCGEELALYADILRTDFRRSRPTRSGEASTIVEARYVLGRMRADAADVYRQLEDLQAGLETAQLDEATLAEIADILDAALICRISADNALDGLNARHSRMEEAVKATPHTAKTSFYRHS